MASHFGPRLAGSSAFELCRLDRSSPTVLTLDHFSGKKQKLSGGRGNRNDSLKMGTSTHSPDLDFCRHSLLELHGNFGAKSQRTNISNSCGDFWYLSFREFFANPQHHASSHTLTQTATGLKKGLLHSTVNCTIVPPRSSTLLKSNDILELMST